MRYIRWGVLLALLGFLGCDVGTATVLLLQNRGKKSGSGPEPATTPPGFGDIFKAWTAKDVFDVSTANAAKDALI
ncbi:MAG TPA: hypothetical protein VK661_00300, partial [Planctomycetota bacterium]|nr:hypothetical protein [Planctomycetota bacterium]